MSGHCERPNQNDCYKLDARKTYICRSAWLASSAEIYKPHRNSLESRDLSASTRLQKDHCLQMPKGLLEN